MERFSTTDEHLHTFGNNEAKLETFHKKNATNKMEFFSVVMFFLFSIFSFEYETSGACAVFVQLRVNMCFMW